MEKYKQAAGERMKFTTLIVKENTHLHNDFKIIQKNGGKLNESEQ
jgi:hypothetical protein